MYNVYEISSLIFWGMGVGGRGEYFIGCSAKCAHRVLDLRPKQAHLGTVIQKRDVSRKMCASIFLILHKNVVGIHYNCLCAKSLVYLQWTLDMQS